MDMVGAFVAGVFVGGLLLFVVAFLIAGDDD